MQHFAKRLKSIYWMENIVYADACSANPDNRLDLYLGQSIGRDTVHLAAMIGFILDDAQAAVLAPQDEAKFRTALQLL